MPFINEQRLRSEAATVTLGRLLNCPQITHEEEMGLARRIQRGDAEAVGELVAANAKLAFFFAEKFLWTGLEVDDIFSEAMIGLREAAQRFEATGAKFSVFASWHIRAAIQNYVAKNRRCFRLPRHIEDKVSKAKLIRANLPEGIELTAEILMAEMSLSNKAALMVLQALEPVVYLDAQIDSEEGERSYGEIIADTYARNGASEVDTNDRLEVLNELLGHLTEREQFVIIRRFGLRDTEVHTLEEIGAQLKVTRERIRQIESKALRKLREAEKRRSRADARLGVGTWISNPASVEVNCGLVKTEIKTSTNAAPTSDIPCPEPKTAKLAEGKKGPAGSGLKRLNIKSPLVHQNDALKGIAREFATASRTKVYMACGTGKTLVSLWAVEREAVKSDGNFNVLVLEPSLSLVKQVFEEWVANTKLSDVSFLFVCSDDSVSSSLEASAEGISKENFAIECGHPVTTSVPEVQSFWGQKNSRYKIVFSTYKSARVVGDAIKGAGEFDMAIFDEAHRTAGKNGKAYAFALLDNNIPVQKRLFLTATPKHYKATGNRQQVYSMDCEQTYGKVAYQLPFRQAIESKLIVPFKVVISVITSSDLRREQIAAGKFNVDERNVDIRHIVNQIALKVAIEKYNVKRIIAFHSKISESKDFVSFPYLGEHVSKVHIEHIDGTQSAETRCEAFQRFQQSDCAVLSNSRVLTEGVDIPSVDMVAFLSPKDSVIDIIQTAGRAMRHDKVSGKQVGYIFLPVFVETENGESLKEALRDSCYSQIWEVLNALAEQDEMFASTIELAAFSTGIKKPTEAILSKLIEVVGVTPQIEELREAICTRIARIIGSPWSAHFGELVAFKTTHNRFPRDGECKLSSWLFQQRYLYSRGLLSSDRAAKLTALGFVWNMHTARWNEYFAQAKEHFDIHGRLPDRSDGGKYSLYIWLSRQRTKYREGKLSGSQMRELDSIRINEDRADFWTPMFQKILEYKKQYGHLPKYPGKRNKCKLYTWLIIQNYRKRAGRLTPYQINALRRLGWSDAEKRRSDQWMRSFFRLEKCLKRHGQLPSELSRWATIQRAKYKNGAMSALRKSKLDSIGFKWNSPYDDIWVNNYEKCVAFKKKHGRFPTSDEGFLGGWIRNQRKFQRAGTLPKIRYKKLTRLGFCWEPARAMCA